MTAALEALSRCLNSAPGFLSRCVRFLSRRVPVTLVKPGLSELQILRITCERVPVAREALASVDVTSRHESKRADIVVRLYKIF